MNGPDYLARIQQFREDPGASAFEAALLVNEFLAPACERDQILDALARLEADRPAETPPWEFLRSRGFPGDAVAVDPLEGSRMDRVLATGRGLPIALGVLLIRVAEDGGMPSGGINFPGHFLVRAGDALIDPFRMEVRSEADCLAMLPPELRASAFEPAGSLAILLRMFNNVKHHYAAAGSFDRGLDVLECQLTALPGEGMLLLEQGEFWLRLGSADGARRSFEAAALAADGRVGAEQVAAHARRRLKEIGGPGSGPATVH